MTFTIRFFYPSERGCEFKCFRWDFPYSQEAEFHARNYAREYIPNCTKICLEWDSGTERKMRILRKSENGYFIRGRK